MTPQLLFIRRTFLGTHSADLASRSLHSKITNWSNVPPPSPPPLFYTSLSAHWYFSYYTITGMICKKTKNLNLCCTCIYYMYIYKIATIFIFLNLLQVHVFPIPAVKRIKLWQHKCGFLSNKISKVTEHDGQTPEDRLKEKLSVSKSLKSFNCFSFWYFSKKDYSCAVLVFLSFFLLSLNHENEWNQHMK